MQLAARLILSIPLLQPGENEMNLNLSKDANGNKTLKVSFVDTDFYGFSIQTNGNLPETHRMTKHDFNHSIAENELNGFVKQYGSDREKDLLGW